MPTRCEMLEQIRESIDYMDDSTLQQVFEFILENVA